MCLILGTPAHRVRRNNRAVSGYTLLNQSRKESTILKRIFDLPDNVLGIEASDKVTAEDYQKVLVPELQEQLHKTKKIRLLYVIGDTFSSYTGAAAWQDAQVGLMHWTQFERIAVVTDVVWIRNSIKVFGFAMPGEVRIFSIDDLSNAQDWVSQPISMGNLSFEFFDEQGILVLHPRGELTVEDFQRVSGEIDPYIEKVGSLKGVIIKPEHFPGWQGLSAFLAHMGFVKNHRHSVKRLAIVSNDHVMDALPFLAKCIGIDQSRHFYIVNKTEALPWVSQA